MFSNNRPPMCYLIVPAGLMILFPYSQAYGLASVGQHPYVYESSKASLTAELGKFGRLYKAIQTAQPSGSLGV
jgi:hypothetical protein